jgi:hypothetical protein
LSKRGFVAALVFLAGCAVGGASSQLVVPKASAQQAATLPAWEYKCFSWLDAGSDAEELAGVLNKLGKERWELAGGGDQIYCVKRPRM